MATEAVGNVDICWPLIFSCKFFLHERNRFLIFYRAIVVSRTSFRWGVYFGLSSPSPECMDLLGGFFRQDLSSASFYGLGSNAKLGSLTVLFEFSEEPKGLLDVLGTL